MSSSCRVSVRSGGQSGVDRAALDIAIEKQIPYSGWCPKGGWAEDFPSPPGLLCQYHRLVETPSTSVEQRTAWNVRDSHATLVLLMGSDASSKGTRFTKLCVELIFVRPRYYVDLDLGRPVQSLRDWLNGTMDEIGVDVLNLNIGGPRESECPGIYRIACEFLSEIL